VRPLFRKVRNPGSAPLRSAGMVALCAMRAQDVLRLSQWRRGFRKKGAQYDDGTYAWGRLNVLRFYANCLRGCKTPEDQALDSVARLAHTMVPPYPSDPDDISAQTVVRDAYGSINRPRYHNDTLCKCFGLNEQIARELGLETIRPKSVALESDKARPHIADLIAARRKFALSVVSPSLTARRLAELYKLNGFSGANHQTANADLNAIGFVNRSTGRRRRNPA